MGIHQTAYCTDLVPVVLAANIRRVHPGDRFIKSIVA